MTMVSTGRITCWSTLKPDGALECLAEGTAKVLAQMQCSVKAIFYNTLNTLNQRSLSGAVSPTGRIHGSQKQNIEVRVVLFIIAPKSP